MNEEELYEIIESKSFNTEDGEHVITVLDVNELIEEYLKLNIAKPEEK